MLRRLLPLIVLACVATTGWPATVRGQSIPPGCSEVYSANCLKPWSIPDRWDDSGIPGWGGKGASNGKWDHENFTDLNGSGLWDPGEPFLDGVAGTLTGPKDGLYSAEPYDPILTGYVANKDAGTLLTFKQGKPPAAGQATFFAVDLPGSVGPDDYRADIANCNPEFVKDGDWLATENADMTGPTVQGGHELIAQDPNAYWDAGCNCVKSPLFGDNQSPRAVAIPMHDPRVPLAPGRMNVHVAKLIGFFVEGVNGGGDILGRFMTLMLPGGEPGPPGGPGYLYTCPVPTRTTSWGYVKAIYR
jgi:hypothetical protein